MTEKRTGGFGVDRAGQGMRTWTMETVRGRCVEQDRCLIWRAGVNSGGYPMTSINGKPGTSVRQYIFTQLLGRKVPKGRRITSRCENKRCCSEFCLMAVPVSKIIRRAHAKRREEPGKLLRMQLSCPFSKLGIEEARAIRASDEPTKVIAQRYGITPTSARAIRKGQAWAEPPVALVSSVFEWRGQVSVEAQHP